MRLNQFLCYRFLFSSLLFVDPDVYKTERDWNAYEKLTSRNTLVSPEKQKSARSRFVQHKTKQSSFNFFIPIQRFFSFLNFICYVTD